MRPALALVLLAACGRIGFDGLVGGGGAGDGGGDSHVGDSPTDAPADAASVCTAFDRTYPATANFGVSGLAWVGDHYVILTVDGLATVSEAGVLSQFTQLSPMPSALGAGQNAIAWSGSELLAVWPSAGGTINQQLFDGSLAPMGAATDLVVSGADQAHAIWADNRFAVLWHLQTNDIEIGEISTAGALIGAQSGTSSSAVSAAQSFVASTKYLVGFYSSVTIPNLIAFDRPPNGNGSAPTIALGTTQTAYLQLANIASGAVIVQAAGTGQGTGQLQALDTNGMPTTGMIALPTDAGHELQFATVVPHGPGAILVGITGAAPAQIVTAIFDPGAASFLPLQEIATQAVAAYGPVAAAQAPGRLLVAIPYADNGGATSHTRLIQVCF